MNTAPKLSEAIETLRKYRNNGSVRIWDMDAALDVVLAALAPPSGEGVAIYQCMCTDDDTLRNGPKDVWMDVDEQSYESLRKRDDVRSRIVYTTPQSAPVDGDSSDLGEVRFPAKGGVWGYGA